MAGVVLVKQHQLSRKGLSTHNDLTCRTLAKCDGAKDARARSFAPDAHAPDAPVASSIQDKIIRAHARMSSALGNTVWWQAVSRRARRDEPSVLQGKVHTIFADRSHVVQNLSAKKSRGLTLQIIINLEVYRNQ